LVSLAAQEWIRQGRAEGIAEGKAEGIAEGEAKGKAEAILVGLETRFGSVPEDIKALVRQAAPEMLDSMVRRVFTTPSPQSLFTDESWH
jgi:flagellar biosynthesis/type III secretory pathway protein FliH